LKINKGYGTVSIRKKLNQPYTGAGSNNERWRILVARHPTFEETLLVREAVNDGYHQ
jgi:hypothetical protein